ncbi:YjcZ family sporulation protein [Bacillus cereus]
MQGGNYYYGYGSSYREGCGFAGGFALLVVLFILLIIIGCSCFC